MSGFEDNFFDDNNPFNDPSITEVTHQSGKNQTGLEGYSPFSANQQNAGVAQASPAIMHPTTQDISPNPPQYSKSAQAVPQYTIEELERQRRELEERKANLDRREAELRNPTLNVRKNNWPPLPENFCVQPCFYQDINLEIPPEFQKIVRHLYYVWMFHGCVMVMNVIGGLALLFQFGEFVTFGVGILYLLLFTPFSFLCWYRPAYKAFRSDSSFNFMVFFFVFFFQFVVTAVLAIGMTGSGSCGILRAISCFSRSPDGRPATAGAIVVGIIVLIVAFAFLVLAAGELLLLTRIHTIYRSSGASFEKAQQEFTKEFLGNQHVRNAASDAAAATIRAQMGGSQQPNSFPFLVGALDVLLRNTSMATKLLKSFDEIPGPRSYPVVGTLLHYLPVIGKYRFDELHRNGLKKYKEFGSVVREEIVPGTNVVWIFSPEDLRELFRKEGRWPRRRSHLALLHYRMRREDLYDTGGLLPTNGPEWHRLRSAFQRGLSSPKNVRSYLPLVDRVVKEFLNHVGERRTGPREDFLPDLSRLYLEMLGLVAFDRRLESFSEEELKVDSRSSRLIEAALDINSCILKTDNGLGLWRCWDTPLYKKLKSAHEYLESVAVDLVKAKLKSMKNSEGRAVSSLLEAYLTSPEISFKDVIGMSSDMLLAGIDTITYTTGFVLYHLATNEEAREKLFEEAKNLLPEPESPVTADVLSRAEYLKAVLKESFRLNPVSVGIGRILAEDAIFSGYRVPKGNVVVTQNQVVCRLEEYFPEPSRFIPERWLKGRQAVEEVDPYLVLPFGHGPRSCIARRLAEQNILTFVVKFFRNFNIVWMGAPLDSKSYLINKPDGPLKLAIESRRH